MKTKRICIIVLIGLSIIVHTAIYPIDISQYNEEYKIKLKAILNDVNKCIGHYGGIQYEVAMEPLESGKEIFRKDIEIAKEILKKRLGRFRLINIEISDNKMQILIPNIPCMPYEIDIKEDIEKTKKDIEEIGFIEFKILIPKEESNKVLKENPSMYETKYIESSIDPRNKVPVTLIKQHILTYEDIAGVNEESNGKLRIGFKSGSSSEKIKDMVDNPRGRQLVILCDGEIIAPKHAGLELFYGSLTVMDFMKYERQELARKLRLQPMPIKLVIQKIDLIEPK